VNSTHHQAVKDLGKGIRVCGVAADGLIEAIESEKHRFMIGVQWHPELLYDRFPEQSRIYRAFIRAAKKR
jgi:putative glutamine amidotransferase